MNTTWLQSTFSAALQSTFSAPSALPPLPPALPASPASTTDLHHPHPNRFRHPGTLAINLMETVCYKLQRVRWNAPSTWFGCSASSHPEPAVPEQPLCRVHLRVSEPVTLVHHHAVQLRLRAEGVKQRRQLLLPLSC
mmetsp:Transcript_7065/g.15503  ORF Transcript_7065/g.15503 Transcript_7065/m.15503 type:complete len:137 (-) Transcript_7065:288-698(-)